MLFQDPQVTDPELRGFFADREESVAVYAALRQAFPELPPLPTGRPLADADWKEAYKLHFKPWSDRGLHFVPEWERDQYVLPEGDAMVLLDPGMAFGTGNHETTRLCLHRLLDMREEWAGDVSVKSIVDAGCGSGILAIAAVKAGFGGGAFAFDNDPDAVRIALENASLCAVAGQIEFRWCGLQEGLGERSSDVVLANILAPILREHVDLLLEAVAPGGALILSGILQEEVEELRVCFEKRAGARWGGTITGDSRVDGQWADVLIRRPGT